MQKTQSNYFRSVRELWEEIRQEKQENKMRSGMYEIGEFSDEEDENDDDAECFLLNE